MSKINLDNLFTYHRPFGTQPQRYEAIRAFAKAFAQLVLDTTPASREQSLALTRIQEATQMANAAIAINEVEPPAVIDQVSQ